MQLPLVIVIAVTCPCWQRIFVYGLLAKKMRNASQASCCGLTVVFHCCCCPQGGFAFKHDDNNLVISSPEGVPLAEIDGDRVKTETDIVQAKLATAVCVWHTSVLANATVAVRDRCSC